MQRRLAKSAGKFLLILLTSIAACCYCGCTGYQPPKLRVDVRPSPPAPWAIQAENAKPGTTAWQITNPATNHEIEGYASRTSVNRGEDIQLYVSSIDPTYTLEIFRMGWYGGSGARSVLSPAVLNSALQPMPAPNPSNGLIECQWTNPYDLHIPDSSDPTDWASGVYLAKLTAGNSGKQSYIVFVVRDDNRPSDLFFQSSVTTYEAYNAWGGMSLYSTPRAFEVSFNRPYIRNNGAGDFLWFEISMLRFLEREGYDVTYTTDVDTHENGDLLLLHKAFLSVGHDEYWSWKMRDHVEAARDQGVNLAFFGANTSYWQIRFLPSFVSSDPDRTIVCYKSITLDPMAASLEYQHLTTTIFRDTPVSRPEESMIGTMYVYNSFIGDIVVSDASSWIFANTGLHNGDYLYGLLGNEVDQVFDQSYEGAHANIHLVAHSPYLNMVDNKIHYADMAYYRASSGSVVVSTGSIFWSYGVDTFLEQLAQFGAQQATRNIYQKFGAVPFEGFVPPH